jgi:hypothetical protein
MVDVLRSHRVMIEPGIAFPSRTTGFARLGYRGVWHPANTTLGFGAGLGSTIELFAPGAAPRPSAGGEVLLHVGACCKPGYVLVVGRYDRFFAGDARDVVTLALGLGIF